MDLIKKILYSVLSIIFILFTLISIAYCLITGNAITYLFSSQESSVIVAKNNQLIQQNAILNETKIEKEEIPVQSVEVRYITDYSTGRTVRVQDYDFDNMSTGEIFREIDRNRPRLEQKDFDTQFNEWVYRWK